MKWPSQLGSGDKITIILVLVIGVPLVGFGGLMWNFNRPPFDLAKLRDLRPGMSQHEVERLLGKPNGTDKSSWHYSRPLAWPIVHVYFDAVGRFKESDYDY